MPDTLPDPKQVGHWFAMAQVGLEMVAPIALGVILDMNLDWSPWGAVCGAILGLVGGFAHLILLSRRADALDSKPSEKKSP